MFNVVKPGDIGKDPQKRSILAFTTWCTSKRLSGLCSLLGVTIELPEFPLSFGVAIRRMGGFVFGSFGPFYAASVLRQVFPLYGL